MAIRDDQVIVLARKYFASMYNVDAIPAILPYPVWACPYLPNSGTSHPSLPDTGLLRPTLHNNDLSCPAQQQPALTLPNTGMTALPNTSL